MAHRVCVIQSFVSFGAAARGPLGTVCGLVRTPREPGGTPKRRQREAVDTASRTIAVFPQAVPAQAASACVNLAPMGVPHPVHGSQPALAVYAPLLPDVTSLSKPLPASEP